MVGKVWRRENGGKKRVSGREWRRGQWMTEKEQRGKVCVCEKESEGERVGETGGVENGGKSGGESGR